MKRRILVVDDEVAVLLTMKAILEISGFDVDTAASARDGRMKLRKGEYEMVITDMRMENDEAGAEVIRAAREAEYRPAVALLTAFPLADEDWQELGADKMLVKPMHTRVLLEQIEQLMHSHKTEKPEANRNGGVDAKKEGVAGRKVTNKKNAAGKAASAKVVSKKTVAKKAAKRRSTA